MIFFVEISLTNLTESYQNLQTMAKFHLEKELCSYICFDFLKDAWIFEHNIEDNLEIFLIKKYLLLII